MKIIFWQNFISILLIPMIRKLAETHEVTIVGAKPIPESRLSSGWEMPDPGRCRVILTPNTRQCRSLLDESSETVHIFTGLNSVPCLRQTMCEACRRHLRILIFSETYRMCFTPGWKVLLRRIHTRVDAIRWGRHIDGILATGELGAAYFRNNGFPRNTFEFAYFPENPRSKQADFLVAGKPSLLFVGSIDVRKNILDLTDEVIRQKDNIARFTIIGRGPLERELDAKIAGYPEITYISTVPNDKISDYMSAHDILILPSQFDGWGAVVNEAFLCGTRAICSEFCGAASLVAGERGTVFSFSRTPTLSEALRGEIAKGKTSPELRAEIIRWAIHNISSRAAAGYLENIIRYLYCGSSCPEIPWRNVH